MDRRRESKVINIVNSLKSVAEVSIVACYKLAFALALIDIKADFKLKDSVTKQTNVNTSGSE